MQYQPANCDFKGDVTQLSWPLQMFVSTMKVLDAVAPQATTNLILAKFVTPRRKRNSDSAVELPAGAQRIDVIHGLTKLTGWTWGESGPAVLVVHGWESYTGRMAPLIETLRNQGYRVFAMDAPGHGLSPAAKTDLLDVSYALQAMMEQYGPFYGVISHSFGAAATAIMLARAPQWMPQKLVLLSPMRDLAQHVDIFASIADLSPLQQERLRNDVAAHVGVPLAQCSAVESVRTFQAPGLIIHDRHDTLIPYAVSAEMAQHWAGAHLLSTAQLGHRRGLRCAAVLNCVVDYLEDAPLPESILNDVTENPQDVPTSTQPENIETNTTPRRHSTPQRVRRVLPDNPLMFVSVLRGLKFLVSLVLVFALLWSAPALTAEDAALQAPTNGTTIVVDTADDLLPTSNTHTCTYTEGAFFFPASDGKCTLRRALREASARPDAERPITIAFNLDPTAAVDGVWAVEINGALLQLFRKNMSIQGGQVIIDGDTQPGGRPGADGPKIMVNTNDYSFEVRVPNNQIRNLGFQGGGTIILYEGGNLIENVWMGLSNDGQQILFRTPGQPNRMAGGGVFIRSNDNIIRNNVISGAFARAVDIQSGRQNNLIENNFIGTRSDGTAPASFVCSGGVFDPGGWYGGWGISLAGSNNRVIGNRIAGLDNVRSANDTPPLAIESFGNNHEIRNNTIGIDSSGAKVGVCGQAIKASDTGTDVLDNVIFGSKLGFEEATPAAILTTGASTGITVRGNLVEQGPGRIYDFGGTQVAQALRLFNAARITNIDGVNVSGMSGENSPCPNCLIDLYLDNSDAIDEALVYLGQTTADANGNFGFTLSSPLAPGFGIRTMSTTQALNVISGMQSGTTTRNSTLYLPLDVLTVTLPATTTVDTAIAVNIAAGPVGGTPATYTIAATGLAPLTGTLAQDYTATAMLTWNTVGAKTITVTVSNGLSGVTVAHDITVEAVQIEEPEEPGDGSLRLYLPAVLR